MPWNLTRTRDVVVYQLRLVVSIDPGEPTWRLSRSATEPPILERRSTRRSVGGVLPPDEGARRTTRRARPTGPVARNSPWITISSWATGSRLRRS